MQALLAAHPDVYSFPETHFFEHLDQHRHGRGGPFVDPLMRRELSRLRDALSPGARVVRVWSPTVGGWVRGFAQLLDRIATAHGASCWIEKTPSHLHYIDLIEANMSDSVFVHVVRNGPEVVASVVDVTRHHPGVWGGARSIDVAARRWRHDIGLTAKALHRPNHVVIRYEQLLDDVSTLDPAWRLLDLVGDASVDHRCVADHLVLDTEPWKARVHEAIGPAGSRLDRFSAAERARILELTSERPEPLTILDGLG